MKMGVSLQRQNLPKDHYKYTQVLPERCCVANRYSFLACGCILNVNI